MMFKRRVWFSLSFWIEVLVFLVCPIPYYDVIFHIDCLNILDKSSDVKVWYLMSDMIVVFMFVRLFFVVRALFNYNMFTDLYSKKLCKHYGFTANIRFAYKCFAEISPGLTVLLTLLTSVFILAY